MLKSGMGSRRGMNVLLAAFIDSNRTYKRNHRTGERKWNIYHPAANKQRKKHARGVILSG